MGRALEIGDELSAAALRALAAREAAGIFI